MKIKKRKSQMKNKIKIILFSLLIIIMLVLDYSASKYGTGIIFNRYVNFPFKFQIQLFDSQYILSSSGYYILISPRDKFPSRYSYNNIYIKYMDKMYVSEKSLYILIKDSLMSDNIIKIDSLTFDFGLKKYEIITSSKKINYLKKKFNWIDISPTNKLHFFVYFWPNLFWLLLIIIILYPTIKIYNWKFRNQK